MLWALIRSHRWGAIGCSTFATLYLVANIAGYVIVSPTETARALFAQQIAPIAQQLSYLLPLPRHLETIGGYVEWRAYPVLAIVLSVWALVAAVGIVRGDEERRLLDVWLSTGTSRTRWIGLRVAAFACALGICVIICAVAGAAGAFVVGEALPLAGVFTESLALLLLVLAWLGLALLLAQFASSRGGASGLAAGVFLLLFFTNSLARTQPTLAGVAALSPFHLFDANHALSGEHASWPAMATLLVLAITTTFLAIAAFGKRDLGAAIVQRPSRRSTASSNAAETLLRIPVVRRLWQTRWSVLAWLVIASLLASLMTSIARSAADLIRQNAVLNVLIRSTGRDPAVEMLGVEWFSSAALALAILATLRTARWSGEDLRGRLEIELAQPVARRIVIMERAAEFLVAASLIAFGAWLALIVAAHRYGIALSSGRSALATALLLPVAMCFAGIGAMLSSWRPRLAAGALTAIVVGGYFLQTIAPLLHWPSWVQDLSIFALYGQPLVSPVWRTGLVAMLLIVALGYTAAIVAFRRRDLGR
jgi:hypothetical protein